MLKINVKDADLSDPDDSLGSKEINLNIVLQEDANGKLSRENYAVLLGEDKGTLYLDFYFEAFGGKHCSRRQMLVSSSIGFLKRETYTFSCILEEYWFLEESKLVSSSVSFGFFCSFL